MFELKGCLIFYYDAEFGCNLHSSLFLPQRSLNPTTKMVNDDHHFKIISVQRKLSMILGLLLLFSCKKCKETNADELCSIARAFPGSELKINGYYFKESINPSRREIFFFYRNGVMLYGELVTTEELAAKEEKFSDGTYYSMAKDVLSHWGNFKISGSAFSFEKWYPSSNRWVAYVNEGVILNDSTIYINRSYRCDGSESRTEDDTFHFKKFGPKPDSTNQFVP